MALIEIYHVIADYYPVHPDWTTPIVEGQCVALNALGEVQRATGAAAEFALGVAGDTMSTNVPTAANPHTPYSAALQVNAAGRQAWTQNRVSDAFDETLASGMLTVYHGGGKFATTEYALLLGAVPVAYAVGNALYVDANGRLSTNVSASAQIMGNVVGVPSAYPSGVPGTDTADGSISLGNYLTFILRH